MKKVIYCVLAAILTFALTTSAFAAEGPTRLEFVSEMFGHIMLDQDSSLSEIFADIDEQGTDVVAAAVTAGIINGYDDGTFRPHEVITAEQAIVMVARFLGADEQVSRLAFEAPEGANISDWARPYFAWAAEHSEELARHFDATVLVSEELMGMLEGMIDGLYTVETISIDNFSHDIPAVVTMPTQTGGAERFPIVIMLHGTGSNKDEAGGGYQILAPVLASNGIGSIRFDFIGNGDSESDYIYYNFTSAVADVNRVVEYAMTRADVDPGAIGIMGWSQGGTIALLAAGENNALKSVVTWAGAPDLLNSSLFTEEGFAAALEDGYSVLEFDWRDSLRLGLGWYEDVINTDVLEVFAQSSAPVLAIIGSEDVVVDLETIDMIVGASMNEDSLARVIDGADHIFNIFSGDMSTFNLLCDMTVEWFQNTLR